MRPFPKRLLELLMSQTRQPDPVPYVAMYLLPEEVVRNLREVLESLRGSVLSQVIAEDGGRRILLVHWSSKERFGCESERLMRELGAQLLSFHGPSLEFISKVEPWWRRINPGTWLLSAAALWGAADAIHNRFDRIFSSPALTIRLGQSSFEILQGSPVEVEAIVLSRLPTSHEDLSITASLLGPDGTQSLLNADESKLPYLAFADTWSVSLRGEGPMPGHYRIRIAVEAEAGWVSKAQRFEYQSDVVVWPLIPNGGINLTKILSGGARFEGWIDLGPAAKEGLQNLPPVELASGMK